MEVIDVHGLEDKIATLRNQFEGSFYPLLQRFIHGSFAAAAIPFPEEKIDDITDTFFWAIMSAFMQQSADFMAELQERMKEES